MLLFSSSVFRELRRALKFSDCDIVTVSNAILQDENSWTEQFRIILDGFRDACRDELSSEHELITEFTEADLTEITTKELALVPSYMCKLFARRANVEEFRAYLTNVFKRLIAGNLSGELIQEIVEALNISMDLAVTYDDLAETRDVSYQYDLDAWLATEQPQSLGEFKTEAPITYRLYLHDGLYQAFERANKVATSIENAAYLTKFRFFPLSADRVFFYLRKRV